MESDSVLLGEGFTMLRDDMQDVMGRVKKFMASDRGVLILVKNIEEIQEPHAPLHSYGLPGNMTGYLDDCIRRFVDFWKKRDHIRDDLIPAMAPWYGIAEHTAFLGGNVQISGNTSWHHQIIHTWDDRKKVSLDENNIWLRLVIDGMSYLREQACGRYLVKLRGGESPMDIVNVLRGNDMFYDFYEYPEEIRELLGFAAQAALYTLTKQAAVADDAFGGVITGFDVWLPGNGTGHLSEDASTMISREHFQEYGVPFTEIVTGEFDHVFMHTHSVGLHNIPLIARIKNIDIIEISNDPNAVRAIEAYKALSEDLKGKTVAVQPTLEEIRENKDFLSDRKTILFYHARTLREAEEAIHLVRDL